MKKLERLIGDKFPCNLDRVLLAAGYDSLYTISQITDRDITDIEVDTTENNPTALIGTKYCPRREDLDENFVFKLKPGHKTFIKSLANVIKRAKQKKNKKLGNSVDYDSSADSEEIPRPSAHRVHSLSPTNLLAKISKFCKAKGLDFTFGESSVSPTITKTNELAFMVIIYNSW